MSDLQDHEVLCANVGEVLLIRKAIKTCCSSPLFRSFYIKAIGTRWTAKEYLQAKYLTIEWREYQLIVPWGPIRWEHPR
jgi:hypothetical protein